MKTATVALSLAALAVLSCIALAHAWADLLLFQGRNAIKQWDQSRRLPTLDDWTLTRERLRNALTLNSGNPAISEEIARLYDTRTRGRQLDAVTTAYLEQSLEYFRQSARARPSSPYTWSNIALAKARLGRLDEEFNRAIENAARLGPWEPEVQISLADIGFRTWNRLQPPIQSTIRANLQRGLKHQDGRVFEVAAANGRLDVLCATPDVAKSKLALRCI